MCQYTGTSLTLSEGSRFDSHTVEAEHDASAAELDRLLAPLYAELTPEDRIAALDAVIDEVWGPCVHSSMTLPPTRVHRRPTRA